METFEFTDGAGSKRELRELHGGLWWVVDNLPWRMAESNEVALWNEVKRLRVVKGVANDTFTIGDRVRIVGGRYCGRDGRVEWLSGISELVGLTIDGRLLGFSPGEVETVEVRDER